MAVSLSDLLKEPTEDKLDALLLALMTSQSFPVSAWQVGGVARTLLKLVVAGTIDLARLAAKVAAGGFLDYATGAWLTLLAAQLYNVIRAEATLAQGSLKLVAIGGAGPYTITPRQLTFAWVSALGTKLYKNSSGGTLNSGSTLTLSFEATEAGADYNAPDGGVSLLLTPLAGVSIKNDPFSFGGQPVITTQGADQETDASLRAKCRAKWGGVGSSANGAGYEFWARTASAEVARVAVAENVPSDGHVTITLASQTGAPTAGCVTDVDAYINGPPKVRRASCVHVHVQGATEHAIPLTATIYASAGANPNAQTQAIAAAQAFAKTLAIATSSSGYLVSGGVTVFRSQVIEELQSPVGVVNTLLTAPAADVNVPEGKVAVFSPIAVTVVLV